MNISANSYFVEHITLRTWFFTILPFIAKKRAGSKHAKQICYYWDISKTALIAARATARLMGISIEKLRYKIKDVRDKEGISVFLKVMYIDSEKVQSDIVNDPVFEVFNRSIHPSDKVSLYIRKSLISYDMMNTGTYDHLLNAILMIQVVAWKTKINSVHRTAVFFIRKRRWLDAIKRQALRYDIELIALPPKLNIDLKKIILRIIPIRLLYILYFIATKRYRQADDKMPHRFATTEPRIATEYSGHLNLEQPECYSDLFFQQQSLLAGHDILLMFNSSDPLDRKKWTELTLRGIEPLALSPRATDLPFFSLYSPRVGPVREVTKVRSKGPELRWLNEKHADYDWWRSYWAEFFTRYNVKVYTSWYKYDAQHVAISDALQSVGGVTTLYQRSYESLPNPTTTVSVDIEFGFSGAAAALERRNGSHILYHVTTGYPGDHRFQLLRPGARVVRDLLFKNGADHIMAYFDENTTDDPRWYLGHDFVRANYEFLLQKVMQNSEFGLVLKPKNPGTLLRRLGPVKTLLEKAIATGRCYIFSEGVIQGGYPPAAAALAADIAVQEGINAATAGMESALCGVPTLLMDQDGWSLSNLHGLGEGKVVFNDWESLWKTYDNHRNTSDGVPGFGDWSTILDELDPFRDGRAAERIGTYLKWLLDGFKAGLSRDVVMADAAERYCRTWGYDKIVSI